MIGFATRLRLHGDAALAVAVLHAHARKEIRHLPILVLSPFFQRVIMTPATIDRQAHKGDRSGFRQIGDVFMEHEIIGGAVLKRVAGRSQNVAGKMVPGFVVGHALADELIKGPGIRLRQLARGYQKHVGPFVGPVIDKLRAIQERVD